LSSGAPEKISLSFGHLLRVDVVPVAVDEYGWTEVRVVIAIHKVIHGQAIVLLLWLQLLQPTSRMEVRRLQYTMYRGYLILLHVEIKNVKEKDKEKTYFFLRLLYMGPSLFYS
jgi:hypothetical protein